MLRSTKKFLFFFIVVPCALLAITGVVLGVMSGAAGGSFLMGLVSPFAFMFTGFFLSVHPLSWILKAVCLFWFSLLYPGYKAERMDELIQIGAEQEESNEAAEKPPE